MGVTGTVSIKYSDAGRYQSHWRPGATMKTIHIIAQDAQDAPSDFGYAVYEDQTRGLA